MRRHRPPLRKQLPPEFFATDGAMRLMVMTLVINNHPEGVSLGDLLYELSKDAKDDSVERAIRDSVEKGFLRREGRLLFTTLLSPDFRVARLPRRRARRRCRLPRRRGDD